MRNQFSNGKYAGKTVAAVGMAFVGLASEAHSQTPAAPVSTVVANPTYVSIPMEIMVNRPAAEVWKRVQHRTQRRIYLLRRRIHLQL